MDNAVLANPELLHKINAGEAFETPGDLAKALPGPPRTDNLNRTLATLEAAGVIASDPDAPTAGKTLTDLGARQLFGLDVADGRVKVPLGAALLPWDSLEPHPDNPREEITDQELDDLADTIEAVAVAAGMTTSGVKQNLTVGARLNPNGKRWIYIGERRWRAVRKLVEAGRLPAGVELPVVIERDTPTLIWELSLVENGQRVDLKPLERAYAFLRLSQSNNWAPPRIAKTTGYDLRTVQESIKVVKEATPENLALHRRNPPGGEHTWQWLRDSVKVAKPRASIELTPAQALTLIEIVHAVRGADCLPAATGMHDTRTARILKPDSAEWSDLRDRLLVQPHFVGGEMYASVSTEAQAWAAEVGYDADAEATLRRLRAEVVGPLEAHRLGEDGLCWTGFLNLPPPEPAADIAEDSGADLTPIDEADAPESLAIGFGSEGSPAASADDESDGEGESGNTDAADAGGPAVALYQQLTSGAPPSHIPAGQPAERLKPEDGLVLVELAHAQQRAPLAIPGRDLTGVATHDVFKHRDAQRLVTELLVIGFANGPRGAWVSFIARKGWAWLEAEGYARKGVPTVSDHQLLEAQAAALGGEAADALAAQGAYHTAWLNPPPRAPAEADTASGGDAASPAPSAHPADPGEAQAADDFQRQLRTVLAEDAAQQRPLTPEEEEEADAASVLEQILDVKTWSPALFAGFLRALGAAPPFSDLGADKPGVVFDGQCATLLAIDPDRPPSARAALAILVRRALSQAAGAEG